MAPPRSSQSPESKSGSSSIFAAFRNLTSLRRNPGSSSSFSTFPAESSTAKDWPNEPVSAPGTPLGSNKHEYTSPDSWSGSSQQNTREAKFEDPIGGPPQLRSLVENLGPEHEVDERIFAADSISTTLDEYVVGNVAAIWTKAKDLLENGNKQAGFEPAYNLLLACMKHSNLRIIERPIFFASTSSDALVARPALCIDALSILTNNGKSLEGLDTGQLASLLAILLDKSYMSAVTIRKKSKNEKGNSSATEELTLVLVFKYIVDSIKFSSVIFETCLSGIIEKVLFICKKTAVESDLQHSLDILDAAVTYSTFPKAFILSSVEILCGIRCSVGNLKSQSIATFKNLLRSHLELDALNALLAILAEHDQNPPQNRNVVRGSVQLLQELVRGDSQETDPRLTISQILPALRGTLSLVSVGLECDVLETLCLLLIKLDPADLVFDDAQWSAFSDIVLCCSKGKAAANLSLPVYANEPDGDNLTKSKESLASASFAKSFRSLADQLIAQSYAADSDRALAIMYLLLRVSPCLDDGSVRIIVDYYVAHRLLLTSQYSWIEDCEMIQEYILLDSRRSTELKLLAFEALYAAYGSAEALKVTETGQLALSLVRALSSTADLQLLDRIVNFAIEVVEWTSDSCTFTAIVEVMKQQLFLDDALPASPSLGPSIGRSSGDTNEEPSEGANSALSAVVSDGLVKIFLNSINKSPDKAERLFNLLLSIVKSPRVAADARINVLKLLAHIRCDIQYAVYVCFDSESEWTTEFLHGASGAAEKMQLASQRPRTAEDTSSKQPGRDAFAANVQLSNVNALASGSQSHLNPVAKRTLPWQKVEAPNEVPEAPQPNSSRLVYCHIEDTLTDPTVKEINEVQPVALPMGRWLETALNLLQKDELDWLTYSYLISHLGAQLMNHSLFVAAEDQIKASRRVLCELLQSKEFHGPPPSTKLKKTDVSICLYQILGMLVSYHALFSKAEEDEIVKAFILGIGSSEKASEICINALSVCCHEIPMSIVKYLESALQKMTQVITQSNIAVHILEFLSGLARLPNLFRNFREEEFKSVFGICFRYLQSVREKRQKATVSTNKSPTGLRPHRDTLSLPESRTATPSLSEVLPQYVFALTYHVMTFWFMSLRLKDRPRQMAWIRQNLIFKNVNGEEVMEEQSQVTIDLMHRVAYSDRDETKPHKAFAQDSDGVVASKSYLVGLSILTVETAGRTGLSHITIRRPSGNKYSVSRPQITQAPPHQVWDHASAYYAADYVAVTPEDIVQSLYSPLSISPSLASLTEGPIPLPDDDATRRSIESFDRISALDGHKIGIIYIGENQTSETDILANVTGSPEYWSYLNDLGTLTELQNATFNTQGLDREYGTDGKFTYCWRDRVSELVFHVTTMMPTDMERDPSCSLKKRHIGNDFVNIIFNNSGKPFQFDTFPSDFNFVNIVISPEARSSFMNTRLESARRKQDRTDHQPAQEDGNQFGELVSLGEDVFFKVTVMTKPGLPKTSPASETQIISGKNLAPFTRLLALNASVFAQVWANRADGEHVSSWRSRLREIVRLRERHAHSRETQIPERQSISQPSTQSQNAVKERASATESMLMRRASAATFLVDSTSNKEIKESNMSGAVDMERTDSSGSRG